MPPVAASDITRIVLLVLVLSVLLASSLWTLLPFLSGIVWATTIAVATWPALLRLQHAAGGRRGPAVALMTALVVAVLILPLLLALGAVLDAAGRSPAVLRDFVAHGLGPAPTWLRGVPFVGEPLVARWDAVAAGGPEALAGALQPYGRAAAAWLLAATGGLGSTLLLILLTIVILTVLYARGEQAAAGVLALAHRLGGVAGEGTVRLAAQAIRSVALGVIVTALIQAALAGLGLWLSGVPHAGLLTALAFILGVAQLGPLLVLAPAVGWLYWTGHVTWAAGLAIWSLPVIALDNVVRPVLIRRGVELPLLLIVAGVIGGLLGFGVVGLFVGPVVLAATYTLALDWVRRGQGA